MEITRKRTYDIIALQRGLNLLSLFAKSEGGLTATRVAKLSGLPVSTVHRFLVNLETTGFLVQENTGVYHLGIACVSIGQAALAQLDVRRISLPHLRDVNRETRETIHLTVRHGLGAVYVEKLDSPEPLRIYSHIGATVPLHCTAVGKILLAYLPPAEQAGILSALELKRFTAHTVSNVRDLQAQLQRVKRCGYAWDLEEYETHIRCIAGPIWDYTGNVSASLSITGPAVRMSVKRLRQLAPLVQRAGRRISQELGYNSSLDSDGK